MIWLMSLSPENNERLKKVAIAALISAIGTVSVKYAKRGDKLTYIYPFEGKKLRGFIAGFVSEKTNNITQFAGEITSKNFWPSTVDSDNPEIILYDHGQTGDQVAELEAAFTSGSSGEE